jgi:hypothetical protein
MLCDNTPEKSPVKNLFKETFATPRRVDYHTATMSGPEKRRVSYINSFDDETPSFAQDFTATNDEVKSLYFRRSGSSSEWKVLSKLDYDAGDRVMAYHGSSRSYSHRGVQAGFSRALSVSQNGNLVRTPNNEYLIATRSIEAHEELTLQPTEYPTST